MTNKKTKETNYLDTSCQKCGKKHTGDCLSFEEKTKDVEEIAFTAYTKDGRTTTKVVKLSDVEKALTTAYNAGVRDALELVDKHDPNVKMKRETSPAYWGNELRKALSALINE